MSDKTPSRTFAWLFMLACVACTAALVVVGVRAEQVSDQMAFLPDTPEVQKFLQVNRRYGNFNTVLIGVETNDILAPASLTRLRDLSDAVGKVAGVSWLQSITTVPEMRASDDGVVVSPLVAEIPKDAAAAGALKARILKTRQIVGELVSPDFTSALVPITMYGDKVAEVYPKIEKIVRDAAAPGFKVYFHGAPAIDQFLARGGAAITGWGIAAGVVFLLVAVLGLRPRCIPAWLLVVAPAAAAGMAAPVLLRLPSSQLSMASGLGAFVFGTMVVLSFPEGGDQVRVRRWKRALLLGAAAFAIASVSLVRSATGPVAGMGAAFAAAVVVVGIIAPAAMRFGLALAGGPDAGASPATAKRRRWWPVTVAFFPSVVAAILIAVLPKPSAENDFESTFGKGSEPVATVDFLERRFGGSEYLTVVANGDFNHPAFLRTLDGLAESLRAVRGVADVVSPTDIFKLVNEAMIGHYRIPDTVSQMQALWFFLEGQPDLGALLYQREQGLVQIRLSPDGAKRAVEVIDAFRRLMKEVPARVGHVDLRLAAPADAARLRERQLAQATGAIAGLLGPKARETVTRVLGSVVPLELGAAAAAPDARLQAAFRERLAATAGGALNAYLTGPSAPVAITAEQAAEIATTLLRETGDSKTRGRAGAGRLLNTWFPGDEQAMTKMSGALQDKARDAQDKALTALLVEELKAAGVDGVAATSELVAALRDFTSPHVFVDAARERVKMESITEGSYDLSGYPVIGSVVAWHAYKDLHRTVVWALAALVLAIVLILVARSSGGVTFALLAVLGPLGAIAWQAVWTVGVTRAIGVQAFIAVLVGFAAAAGAVVVAVGAASRAKALTLGALVAGAPLLVMAPCGFVPVGGLMQTCAAGVLGAWFGVLAASTGLCDTYTEGEVRR